MSKLSQDEYEELSRDAEIASCADGQPSVFVDKLRFVNRGCIYTIGECERCGEFDWSWTEAGNPPNQS